MPEYRDSVRNKSRFSMAGVFKIELEKVRKISEIDPRVGGNILHLKTPERLTNNLSGMENITNIRADNQLNSISY